MRPERYAGLAKELGATLLDDRKRPTLAKDGVLVEVREMYIDRVYSVRLDATLPSPGIPSFRIYPEGFQSFMSKLLGGHDIEVGHTAFDLMFMVKGRAPEIVKQLWTREACDRLVKLRDVAIEGDANEIELTQRAAYPEDPDVRGAVELVFMLAAVDLYGRDVLRALPDAKHRPDVGEVWLPGPGNLRFGFSRTDAFPEEVMINLRADCDPMPEITPALAERFARFGTQVTPIYQYLYCVWSTTERDPANFLGVVDLLRQLIAAPREVYR